MAVTTPDLPPNADLLLIAGRAAVGKTAVSIEVSARLKNEGLGHCWIDGDWLDLAVPQAPAELFDLNFQALWHNYRDFGCTRLIYSNWASVNNADRLIALMGGRPRVVAVLLVCSDDSARRRLRHRETSSGLDWHLANLDATPVRERDLDGLTPDWVTRVNTDDRSVGDIAAEVVALTGWMPAGAGPDES